MYNLKYDQKMRNVLITITGVVLCASCTTRTSPKGGSDANRNPPTYTPTYESPPQNASAEISDDSFWAEVNRNTERDLAEAAASRRKMGISEPTEPEKSNAPVQLSKKELEQKARESLEAMLDEEYRNIINDRTWFTAGVCIPLVVMVKQELHNPNSFKHVETRHYRELGDMLIIMRFRARNSFNAVVLNEVVMRLDIMTRDVVSFEYNP
ncbi:MAG TPA: hypothetical protein VIN11_00200 [Roseivirga sp.]